MACASPHAYLLDAPCNAVRLMRAEAQVLVLLADVAAGPPAPEHVNARVSVLNELPRVLSSQCRGKRMSETGARH